jgi:leader peptidase (prepilin peptidase) / N-methyltransferase
LRIEEGGRASVILNSPSSILNPRAAASAWRRRVGIEPTLRRFRAETTVLKTAEATRPHSPPHVVVRRQTTSSADDNIAPLDAILAFAAAALGSIIGSFLNVVIHRYPREESVVFPASHCPNCDAAIRPYDNIPVLSYLWLLGRCRACKQPFSARYPLVELANALFYLAIYLVTGPTLAFLAVAAIVSMTIVLIFIDLEIQILPDVIDIPGIAIGLGIGALNLGAHHPELTLSRTWLEAVTGAAVGGGVILAIALAYKLVRKIEGMGMGDVKMMAMIGAVLGWQSLLPVLLIASFTGAVIGIGLSFRSERGMQLALPFGVFLGLATLVMLFFGRPLMEAWLPGV